MAQQLLRKAQLLTEHCPVRTSVPPSGSAQWASEARGFKGKKSSPSNAHYFFENQLDLKMLYPFAPKLNVARRIVFFHFFKMGPIPSADRMRSKRHGAPSLQNEHECKQQRVESEKAFCPYR